MQPEPAPEQPARIQVTVTDLDSGDTDTAVISDDYILTCAGSCYVAGATVYRTGTHVLTIRGRKQVP
jgi:hypothetical protein